MNILLTNDDGIEFPGIHALQDEFADMGNLFTFAPRMEKSATSQAMTLYEDIYVKPIDDKTFIVNGFPVDCVNIALHGDLVDVKFDLLISGINKGVNMGEDILYSGTVGAALHGFIHGIPSIAISSGYLDKTGDFTKIARFLRHFIEQSKELLKTPVVWNINYPSEIKTGETVKWTKLGTRIYRDKYIRTHAEDGAFFFNLGGSELNHKEAEGTDFDAYSKGHVSVTPLTTDATDYSYRNRFK
ncbi:MAG: 5'/3'-nucleotidase SurE [Leptospirales bacterium]